MITRTSLPSFPVVSDAELREWLRIDSNTDTLTLNLLLLTATEMVEAQTGTVMQQASYRIDFADIRTCYTITISPIQSISRVFYSIDDTEYTITDFTYDRVTRTIHLPSYPDATVTVELIAGYPTAAAIPDALRFACAVLSGALYDNREALDEKTVQTVRHLCAKHRSIIL